jgi:hypothetical protein
MTLRQFAKVAAPEALGIMPDLPLDESSVVQPMT